MHPMRPLLLTLYIVIGLLFSAVFAQRNDAGNSDSKIGYFKTKVPAHAFDLIMGNVSDDGVSFSVLPYLPSEACISWQTDGKALEITAPMQLKPLQTETFHIKGLKPDKTYTYRFLLKNATDNDFQTAQTGTFHTQRAKGAQFSFTITADSHLDENTDTAVFTSTLLKIAAEKTDFHIDLGDIFMTDKYRENYTKAYDQYLAQRYYFSLTNKPFFLVLGNHDGEQGGNRPEMTEWSTRQRLNFFPFPQNTSFYSVPDQKLRNYYAWTWGDVLFVVLDPFRYSPRSGNNDPWERTLGDEQYQWLNRTLSESNAVYKLVFIHNLVGGVDTKGRGRGGVEAAHLYEWGGQNPDGNIVFGEKRTGWNLPVHDLLRKYHVNIVFHGHDHVYARQVKDGILYQCLPQPGAKNTGSTKYAEEYGYTSGIIKNNPGYLKVSISNQKLLLEYKSAVDASVLDSVQL